MEQGKNNLLKIKFQEKELVGRIRSIYKCNSNNNRWFNKKINLSIYPYNYEHKFKDQLLQATGWDENRIFLKAIKLMSLTLNNLCLMTHDF